MMTTEAKQAKMMERVGLLLRKAESTTPEEAEALTEAAAAMMLRYGISEVQARVAAGEMPERPGEKVVERVIALSGTYAAAQAQLAGAVGGGLGTVRIVLVPGNGSKRDVHLFGYESDVLIAETLITSLFLQSRIATEEYMKLNRSDFAHLTPAMKSKERKSFLIGFADGVLERISEMRKKAEAAAEAETTGTALAIRDRKAIVDEAVSEKFDRLKRSRSLRVNRSGYRNGITAGRNASIGLNEISGDRRALPAR